MAELKPFNFIPSGRKGLFTYWSDFELGEYIDSFAGNPNTMQVGNAWEQRLTDAIFHDTNGSGAAPIWNVHIYNALDTSGTSIVPSSSTITHAGSDTAFSGTATLYYEPITGGGASTVATTTTPHEVCFLTVKNRCFIAGATMTPLIVQRFPSYKVTSWGRPTPLSVLSYKPYTLPATGTADDDIGVFYKAAAINCAGAATLFTGAAFFVTGTTWQGKYMRVNNAEEYTIDTVADASNLNTTTNGIVYVNKDVEVHYGSLSWTDQPPKYSYAYYRSDTGHITNMAPILTLSEQDKTNVNVKILNIPVTNDTVYDRIVLFRNLVGGGADLYPLFLQSSGGTATITADGLIDNTVAAANVSYVDKLDNNQLYNLGGFAGQPFLNKPAPSDLRFIEYWDGRIWGVRQTQPFRVCFTASPGQVPFGVPEECWPDLNFVDVPNTDGNCTGLHVIGTSLIICTNRYLYYMSGSSEASYKPVKLSSRGIGVNHWAIDEHPGDSTTDTASAIYVSRDKRLWRHYPGGRIVDIGFPIQDKLDTADMTYTRPFIVRVFQKKKSYFVAVGIINAAKTAYSFYFYDFEHDTWHDFGLPSTSTHPPFSFTTGPVFTTTAAYQFASINGNDQYRYYILDDVAATDTHKGYTAPTNLETHVLDFGDRKGLKTIEKVVVYVNDTTLTGWNCEIRFDGSTGSYSTMALVTTTGSPRFKGTGILEYNMKDLGPIQCHGAQFKITLGGSGANGAFGKIYKIQILYRAESTLVSGSQ